jgi:acyl-CoA hydrolase
MVQVVLPNDANPLGFILGGTVMHLIDICGAIACHRHTRSLLVTAAVDGLQFLHPIKVGDLIILRARVTRDVSDVARSDGRSAVRGDSDRRRAS